MLLVIGKKFEPLAKYLNGHGYEWRFLKDKTLSSETSPDQPYLADFSSKERVLQSLDQIDARIDGLLNLYELYVVPMAWIAERLDVPSMPLDAAQACVDKYLMRSKFALAPKKINPDFATADSWESVEAFARAHDFPLILKPAGLQKSLLITRNDSLEQLKFNFEQIQRRGPDVYKKYAPGRQPRFVIEEFMTGSMHAVDAFVNDKGEPQILENVVDYETGHDIGIDDNFHYSRILPSRLETDEQEAVRETAALGIKALGMRNSPAHCEVIFTPDGPRIMEIGARSGGYRAQMHDLANGIDIYAAMINNALGKPVDITPRKNDFCAVLEIFPKMHGAFSHLEHEETLRKLPSLVELKVTAEPGEKVGKSSEGFKMTARITLHTTNEKQFQSDLDFIKQHVAVALG